MPTDLLAIFGTGFEASWLGRLPLLSILVFFPAAGAVVIALAVREDQPKVARRTALAIALLSWLPAAVVLAAFRTDPRPAVVPDVDKALNPAYRSTEHFNATQLQDHLTERRPWLGDAIGSTYYLGLDGTGLWLVMLTAFLAPIAVSASWNIDKRVKEYFVLLLLLQSAMLGVFLAQDLLLFYIFFEFTLIPMFLIIGIWGGPERRFASIKFFLYTFAGSVLTFAGLLWLVLFYSQTTDLAAAAIGGAGRPITFDMQELFTLLRPMVDAAGPDRAAFWEQAQLWLFLALLAGFAIKIPLFPFHTWLPLAHVEAPTAGSVILAAVLLKMGTYGLLKIAIPLAPAGAVAVLPWVVGAAIIGIVYGALTALAQRDIKRLIAYSSVSHLGWCVVGMFALTEQGFAGSLMQMVNHGLSTGALFVVVGLIYDRWHTRDIESFGGLWKSMPVLAFFLIVFTLSSVGLPGLNGFVGEFLVLAGMFQVSNINVGTDPDTLRHVAVPGAGYAILSATGIVLGAWYMFYLCRRLLFGAEKFPAGHAAPDLNWRERLTLIPLALLILLIGVFPRFFLKRMEGSVTALRQVVERGGVQVEQPQRGPLRVK